MGDLLLYIFGILWLCWVAYFFIRFVWLTLKERRERHGGF